MPCLTCGTPIGRGGYCASHRPAGTSAKARTTTQRGYGRSHQVAAARLRQQRRPCCLCGQDIDYALKAPHPASFSAHHLTADKAGPIDASHRVCNERAGRPAE